MAIELAAAPAGPKRNNAAANTHAHTCSDSSHNHGHSHGKVHRPDCKLHPSVHSHGPSHGGAHSHGKRRRGGCPPAWLVPFLPPSNSAAIAAAGMNDSEHDMAAAGRHSHSPVAEVQYPRVVSSMFYTGVGFVYYHAAIVAQPSFTANVLLHAFTFLLLACYLRCRWSDPGFVAPDWKERLEWSSSAASASSAASIAARAGPTARSDTPITAIAVASGARRTGPIESYPVVPTAEPYAYVAPGSNDSPPFGVLARAVGSGAKLPLALPVPANGPAGGAPPLLYCGVCSCFRPERAVHCSVCNRCVLRYDHHSLWLSTCIGVRNIRFVILVAVYLLCATVVSECVLIGAIVRATSHRALFPLAVALSIAVAGSFLAAQQLFEHLPLIARNQTRFEADSAAREEWRRRRLRLQRASTADADADAELDLPHAYDRGSAKANIRIVLNTAKWYLWPLPVLLMPLDAFDAGYSFQSSTH